MTRQPLEQVSKTGLLASMPSLSPDRAVAVAGALERAGLEALDFPLGAPSLAETIQAVSSAYPQMLMAVSGVRTADDARRAQAAGAAILLGSHSSKSLLSFCEEQALCLVPLCAGATEVEAALRHGFSTMQLDAWGQVEPCARLYELFKQDEPRFIVGGGVTAENHLLFADKLYVAAVRGDFLCPQALCEAGREEELRAHALKLYHQSLGFELGHVGVNTEGEEEGHRLADDLSAVFGAPAEHGHIGNWDLFRGIEVVNGKGPGLHGHIAVQCNSLIRAIYYLERNGHPIREESFRFRYPGRLSFAYLEESFGGFAIHLMLRWTAP